jgi:predicted RNA-binding protein with PIN domain
MRPLLIVDAANVVGSVPDGWWRDRAAATRRLRDALAEVASKGLREAGSEPLEVLLVVEGAARPVAGDADGPDEVRVVASPRSGDDTIVDLVRESAEQRQIIVVTADRALRQAVSRLGASVLGPRSLPHLSRRPEST